jgi:PadR family transcriptional regulator PadR
MVSGGAALLAQMRRGSIEYCVLALLLERERYGFELVRDLTAADGIVTSEGTVYPLLTRLRQDGLVDTSWQESHQGPPRKYYRITPEGKTAVHAFAEQWVRFRGTVDRLLIEAGVL